MFARKSKYQHHSMSRILRACRKRLAEALQYGCIPVEQLEDRRMLAGWGPVGTSGSPPPNGAAMMLLSDGTVIMNTVVAIPGGINNSPTTNWFRLTPNGNDYANGTWSQIASMNEGRLFSTMAMLPSGKVFIIGGEYPKFSNTSEIFDPLGGAPGQGSWTYTAAIPTPPTDAQLQYINGAVTNASNTTPITITFNVAGGAGSLANGNSVIISGVQGNTAANGTWTIGNVTANSFTLNGSTGNGAFVPGGGAWNWATSEFGDDPIMLLPDGKLLVGYFAPDNTTPAQTFPTYVYDPVANTWRKTTGGKLHSDWSDEESWVKLPDNSVLSYDVFGSQASGSLQAQRYIPSTDTWIDASSFDPTNKPAVLSDPAPPPPPGGGRTFPPEGSELGPGLLLPDKRVIYFGANGNTAYYDTVTNRWSAGLKEPQKPLTISSTFTVTTGNPATDTPTFLVGTDDPGAVLPNGHVLIALSPLGPLKAGGGYSFPSASYIYDFNPLDPNPATAWTEVTPGGLTAINAYQLNMLMLPTGQVLLDNELTGSFQIYSPDGQPDDSWRPVITGIGDNGDNTYTLTGTQLNGMSEGASYGDDLMQSSNYPIVELRDSNDSVTYARTYNWSNKGGVASGPTPETVQFTLPPGKTLSDYVTVTAIANGIPSAPAVNGLGPSINLGEFSNADHAPAIAWVNGQAYIAWRGRSNHLLNIMRLNANGTPVEPHFVAGATVDGSPALTTIGNQMYVSFTGQDEHLYISLVTINGNNIQVPALKKLDATSNDSPALASFNGKLYLAWTGQGDDLLNIEQLNLDYTVAGSYVSGASVAGSPALAAAYGRLWVAFTGDSDSLYVSAVDINGSNIGVQPLNPLPETSDFGPALADLNGVLNIAWTSQGSNSLNLMRLNVDGTPVEPHIIDHGNSSDAQPALASNNGGTGLYGFTGTDGNGTLHVSFAGQLPPAFGAAAQGGVVVVNGGNVADVISVGKNASGDFEVTLNGTTTSYKVGDVSSVVIYTSPLNNTINVLSTLAGLPVTINTGPGINTINVAAVAHNLAGIAGPLTINGAAEGTTTLILDDSADGAAQTYSLTRNSFADDSTTITFANLGGLVVKGGSGANVYNVTGVAPNTAVSLNVGAGAATVNIASTGNPQTSILGPLSITGTTGSTNLKVDDQLDPAAGATINVTTHLTAGTISGLVPGIISYDAGAHVSAVNLLTNHGGGNSVNLLATGVPVSINLSRNSAAIAANFVTVGSGGSIQPIGAPVSLGDPGNADTIFIDAGDDLTIPFTLEQFTPAGDTPFGRLLSFSPAPITFRLADTAEMRIETAIGIGAVVLADQSGPPGIKGLAIQSQPNVTVRNMTLPNGLSATGTSGLHLTGNTIGTTTLLNDSASSVDSNTMGQVTLNHSANPSLTGNTMQSLTLTGATAAPLVNNNSIIGALAINGASASNVTITNNRIGNVLLAAPSNGAIQTNDIGWKPVQGNAAPAVGLDLQAAFNGTITNNDIHAATLGVNYAVPEQLIANRIFGNATGLVMPINDTTGGLGFFAGSGANDIFNNGVGVNLTGRMQLQHIYANVTGVIGSGILGGDSLDTANLIETNTTGADFTGTIQFNRIARNATGILAHTNQIVIHNLIYRNTGAGVRTNGANDARIYDNTFYATAGNNVQVDGASNRVELLNNIFQADGGTDLFVANDSRTGFFSDYNDLYSTGAGKVAHYILDFSDLLDLQRDVGLIDLHSIGTSTVNPLWAQPRFANLAADDYHIAALVGSQHASSPTIDAGDPLTDLMLPPGYINLLANPSFESGTSTWAVNLGGTTQGAAVPAWNGASYFYAGAVGTGFAEQTVSLTSAGFTPQQLDAQNLAIVFGGRVRSATESPVDQGKLILTFLDDSGNPIGNADTAPASNSTDRWELLGDRVHVPVGARSVKYRFETLRQSGTTDDSFLDASFLYVLPESTAPDQGAYGNLAAGEVTLAAPHIQLRSPQLYVDWELNQPHAITWTSFGGNGSPVRIDLYRDSGGVPTLLSNITPSTPDTGSFTWIPQQSGLNYGTFGLRIQVSLVNGGAAPDISSETFAIPEHTQTYYVNDGSTANDQYTSAIGSNRNTGRLPSSPKPFLSTILSAYALTSGDTVYIDTGTYQHINSVVLSGNPALGNGQGATILGPTNAATLAQISIPDPKPVFDISAGNFVSVSHLTLGGGSYGVYVHNVSSNFSGTYLTLANNSLDGIRLDADSSANALLDHITATGNGRDGISIGGLGVNLTSSIAHNNAVAGIRYDNSGAVSITGNQSYSNKFGLVITNGNGNPLSTVGNADLSLGVGNIIHDNTTYGINASGSVVVAGNTVFNTGAPTPTGDSVGINLAIGAWATQNIVYGNYTGISSSGGGSSAITNNRVYNNAGTGILASNSTPASGNVSYANAVGIEGDNSPTWSNNLLYADSVAGIWLHNGFAANIFNNTINLTTGDGIRIESPGGNFSFQHVNVRNNIIQTASGYDLTLTPSAEVNFQSDYNDLYVTGSGKVALWEGVARPTLQAWRLAGFTDFNSISQNPLFVNAAGEDFHEQSTAGSFHGGSLAPLLNPSTGLPTSAPGTLTSDPATSPAVDRGDANSAFTNETGPNGGFINLGAYGNTAQASRSSIPYVLVLSPDGAQTLIEGENFNITWRSEVQTGTASIELMNGSTVVQAIATGIPNSGSFAWSIPTSITPGNYTIRITRSAPFASVDTSDAAFAISAPIHAFYVNDSTVQAGDFTTAPGNDLTNSGLDVAHPMASIRALLQAYNLAPGDVIDVDAGTYTLSNNIVIPATRPGIVIRGFHDPANAARAAVIDRGSTAAGTSVIDVQGAINVTLDHLTLIGGETGVNLADNAGSTGFTLSNSDVSQASNYDIYIGPGNAGATLTGNRIHDASGSVNVGINVGPSPGTTISNNQVYNNARYGISVGAGNTVSGNTVYGNGIGITADSATVSGNIAHDNGNAGIFGSGSAVVTGNTTYNQNLVGNYFPRAGIQLLTGTAMGNISYGNAYGILSGGTSTLASNRLYNNAVDGINCVSGAAVTGNVIYANGWGIEANIFFGAPASFTNNLIYSNSTGGLRLVGGYNTPVTNNTIFQPTGDAFRLVTQENQFNISLRDNILWASAGYDIWTDPSSQSTLSSDYNDLYVTGTGKIGLWQNGNAANLGAWQLASLQDTNSLFADPLFVNSAAADFHEQSLFGSFHGGSLAPMLDAGTGLPVPVTATLASDASQSPAIDRGDASFPFAGEPAPNGGFINLGAYGNTAQASKSPASYVIVIQPSGGQTLIEGQPFTITWRNANIGSGLVTIDLMTFSGGNATLQSNIATGVANSGQYNWSPDGSIPPGSSYLIRVTQQGGPSALSPAVFSLAAQTHQYYVNDATVQAGDWTTAPGNDTNSGLDPAHPKASIASILSSFALTSLDTILVDSGTYNLTGDITLGPSASGITIRGYNDPAFPTRRALLDRGNTVNGVAITLAGASNVTLDHLALTGGLYGVQSAAVPPSPGLAISNCEVYGNSSNAIYLIGAASNFTLTNSFIHDDDQGVISLSGATSNLTITGNTISHVRLRGISVVATGGLISGNTVTGVLGVAAIEANGILGALLTVSNNIVHDNSAGFLIGNYVLAVGNTAYNNAGQIGFRVNGGELRSNLAYNNAYGFYVDAGLADLNRAYNNTIDGMYVGAGTVSQNQVYSNPTGIEGFTSPAITNNLVYANTLRGIYITGGVAAQILSNTVYQPQGDAIDLLSSEANFFGQQMRVRNNILWAQSGYDLNLTDHAATGFFSDYNDLYVSGTGKLARISNRDYPALADWSGEYGYDTHSLSVDPKFANLAGPDGLLGYSGGADHGADDNFHLQSTSLAIDAGDLAASYFVEPAPNGGRINLGNLGNTPQADLAPTAQSIQVLSPYPGQKLEAGHNYTLSWHTGGVIANQPALLIDTGGAAIAPWQAESYNIPGNPSFTSVTNPIDVSAVTNPAPQGVYQSFTIGNTLAYQLPVPDGSYKLRLHFMEYAATAPGQRLFDIKINGQVVKTSFDIFAAAGARFKADAESFDVSATAGAGLLIELVSINSYAILSGIELDSANPSPIASPTANLQISTDHGANWSTIASNQPLDAYGNGSFLWTAGPQTSGPSALFRVLVTNSALVGTSGPFAIYNGGADYYVNDSSLAGDSITTASGNSANSGKSPDSPLADIQAVLAQYNPGAGATIHVDAGTYTLVHNIILTAANSGLKIQGPANQLAIINRANVATADDNDFLFAAGASNITLDHLSITGATIGIKANFNVGALGNVISNNLIYGNSSDGMYLGSGNNGWVITQNTIHDNTGSDFIARGMEIYGSAVAVSNNTIFNERQNGIFMQGGAGAVVSGNEIYAAGTAIQVNGPHTVSGNLIHDNTLYGILASAGTLLADNTIYRQTANNSTGIYILGGEARGNRVYYNYNGIVAENSANTLDRNIVYSNTNFGILLSTASGGVIENLVYANSAAGIVLTSSSGEQIANNTVYQLVGDAVRFTGSPSAVVRSNIFWVEAGFDLDVTDVASQSGFVSDYNDLYHGAASAHVGFWGGTRDQLLDWQTASAQDGGSIAAAPQFVSIKGADQVLGYDPAGVGYNGGADDNFYPVAGSPAIDHGYTWSGYTTDILGQPRADDVGTPNAGSGNYVPADLGTNLFSATGTATNWRGGAGNYWLYNFTGGFRFPFYGTIYTSVNVSVAGMLQFAGLDSPASFNNSDAALMGDVRIAPFWSNLRTDQAGNNIYVDTSIAGQVKFTWVATSATSAAPANFSVVLFGNGQIRFDYGPGNANFAPTVGLSMGDGQHATFLSYDNSNALGSSNSILIGLPPGFVDQGAYEFLGSSNDVVPPSITATSPPAIFSSGSISPLSQIGVTFSESINPIDAAASGNYQLLGAGADGQFGTADDQTYPMAASYTPGSTAVTLKIPAGPLPPGVYRLSVFGNGSGIHDVSGLLLDGLGNGIAGSNFVRTFTVTASPLVISVPGNGTLTISSDATSTNAWVNHNPATDPPDYTRITAGITTFTVIDGAGHETIVLDYSQGHDPLPASGLSITGTGNDTLQLIGTAGNDAFTLDASSLRMGGMTPIALGGTISSIQLRGNGGPDALGVTGGATTISADLGAAGAAMSVQVRSSASINFTTTQHLRSLELDNNASVAVAAGHDKPLSINSLSLLDASKLDLIDNDLILPFSASSPESLVEQWVKNWFNLHTGPMLLASHFNDATSPFLRTLAVSDNRDLQFPSFAGQTFALGDFNQVLVKYTYLGDVNLDGRVTPRDYAIIDGQIGLGHDWGTGDANSDGKVSPADYAQVDGNIGAGTGGMTNPQLVVAGSADALPAAVFPLLQSSASAESQLDGNALAPAEPIRQGAGGSSDFNAAFSDTPIRDDLLQFECSDEPWDIQLNGSHRPSPWDAPI